LAVGHLDYVDFKKPKIKKQYKNTLIYDCPQLDDRLGVWVILDQLKKAGIKCDILLTDSEEDGQSTAQYFKPPKQYNWMMEFDRQGGGTAMYDYEDQTTRDLVREYDYDVDHGSFTDLCELYHLKCKGFNFGVGYHRQHTDKCYANLSETFDSLRKVQSMYRDWSDTYLEHKEVSKPIGYTGYTSNVYRGFNSYTSTPVIRSYDLSTNKKAVTNKPVTRSTDHLLKTTMKGKAGKIQRQVAAETAERLREEEMLWEQESAKQAVLDTLALDLYGNYFMSCTQQQKSKIELDYNNGNYHV